MRLIFGRNCGWSKPVTSLTQIFNLSNNRTVPDNPTILQLKTGLEAQGYRSLSIVHVWKLKAIEAFRFPRKGKTPSLTIPVKHGGGQGCRLLLVQNYALLAYLYTYGTPRVSKKPGDPL